MVALIAEFYKIIPGVILKFSKNKKIEFFNNNR
jgi:hypothetical protein